MTLTALLCVLTFFSIAARRSPSVYVANLTVIPGFSFSKTDSVSGIIWPVISGLDTTATVTVPLVPLLLVPLAPVLDPLLEHAAAAATATVTAATAAILRFLNLVPNLEKLITEPPPR